MKNGAGQQADVAVIGGGLAGLTAATYLARGGRSVAVFERSSELGGRAATQERSGFSFNLGPHALYRKREAYNILRELGVEFSGHVPPTSGYGLRDGALHVISTTPWWFLTTKLLSTAGKFEAARLLVSIQRRDPRKVQHLSVGEWLTREARQPEVRQLLDALVRVSTYANDPERLSAGVAVAQLQGATAGVLYVDRGWQVLVEGLRKAADGAGVRIVTGARVAAIEHDRAVRGVRLDNGATWSTSAVVVAASPSVAEYRFNSMNADAEPLIGIPRVVAWLKSRHV